MAERLTPIAMTVAGSDSGGGAGIQADLKTFSALGVYGASVITALTAQNTQTVTAIAGVEPAFVSAQFDAVMSDIGAHAIKIGMLGNPQITHAVADCLNRWQPAHIVVDPVMIAKSGDQLLSSDAIEALRTEILPQASLITPNLPEAVSILGCEPISRVEEMETIARQLLAFGPKAILLKGGHLEGSESPDVLVSEEILEWLPGKRHATKNTHGTGCTLSAAITSFLAKGLGLIEAVQAAKTYIQSAIQHADDLQIGSGHGPVHHFHHMWPKNG